MPHRHCRCSRSGRCWEPRPECHAAAFPRWWSDGVEARFHSPPSRAKTMSGWDCGSAIRSRRSCRLQPGRQPPAVRPVRSRPSRSATRPGSPGRRWRAKAPFSKKSSLSSPLLWRSAVSHHSVSHTGGQDARQQFPPYGLRETARGGGCCKALEKSDDRFWSTLYQKCNKGEITAIFAIFAIKFRCAELCGTKDTDGIQTTDHIFPLCQIARSGAILTLLSNAAFCK